MASDAWPSQWLRGPLPLCALAIIREGPLHGYGIATALGDAGLGAITGGTLYPMLGRLERDGLIEAEWIAGGSGPARKVYRITEGGERALVEEAARWDRFATITRSIVRAAPAP